MHVAGRIEELRRIGFGIATRKGPHRVALYVLELDPGEPPAAVELSLLDAPASAVSSAFDPFSEFA